MKRRFKLLVDVAMYVLFLYLLGYGPGRGLLRHGILGCVLFALFLLHHLLNLGWYRGLRRGKYSFTRTLFLLLNGFLTAAMLAMMASAVMLSGRVFPVALVPDTELGRTLHTVSAAWCFLLMSLHVGLHTHAMQKKLWARLRDSSFSYAGTLLYVLVLAVGLWCFWASGLWRELAAQSAGSGYASAPEFYIQHLMMTLAACQLMHLTLTAGTRNKSKGKDESQR